MVYKVSMVRTINDPNERKIRLNELFKVFSEESKTAINVSVSEAGTLTAEKATDQKSQPKP